MHLEKGIGRIVRGCNFTVGEIRASTLRVQHVEGSAHFRNIKAIKDIEGYRESRFLAVSR